MAKQNKLITEMATAFGFKDSAARQSAYGVKDGYLTQMAMLNNGGHLQLNGIVRTGDEKLAHNYKEAFAQAPAIKAAGLKTKDIEVTDDIVAVKFHPGLRGFAKAPEIVNQMNAVLQTMSTVASGPGLKCRECSKAVNEAFLLNGVVDAVCEGCLERLHEDTRQVREAYHGIPMRLGRAFVAGSICAVLGAIAWGVVIVATNRIFWLLAIGIGYFVGWGTHKAAGRGGKPVQVIGALFSVLSVMAGLLVFAAIIISRAPAAAGEEPVGLLPIIIGTIITAPTILIELGSTTLFTLGGGVFGAVCAAQVGEAAKIEVVVEK